MREITRKIDEQINSVRRELANLLSIGIISSDTNNNRLYYEVNQKFDHYPHLSAIFGGKKGAVSEKVATDTESDDIKAIGNVEITIYTGQFTRDETSGIDIMIVGDINQTKLQKFISELEAKEGKELRYTVMSASEYNYRKQINDRFLNTVLSSKKQIVVDKNNVFSPRAEKAKQSKAKE